MRFNVIFDLTLFVLIHIKKFNLANATNENNKEHKKKWAHISDHPYQILIIGCSESGRQVHSFI